MSCASEIEVLQREDLDRAVELLRSKELLSFPTETVYGLGAILSSEEAILKIFAAKGRALDNPLIAHISDVQQAEQICPRLPDSFYRLAKAFFPGPLTVVVPCLESVPSVARAGLPTIGIRMPNHPLALALIARVGEPLVAPSANLSGKPSATRVEHVLADFKQKIAAVLDGGPCEVGVESTIISLQDPLHPLLLRPGVITVQELESCLGRQVALYRSSDQEPEQAPLAPGMRYRHYAPKAPLSLCYSLEEIEREKKSCRRPFLLASAKAHLSDAHLLNNYTLFESLRKADDVESDKVLIYCDEEIAGNAALMNRLEKAASGS